MQLELDRKQLKAQARARMKADKPPFYLVTLLFLALTTGVSKLAQAAVGIESTDNLLQDNFLALFVTLLLTLYQVVLTFGYQWWCLRRYRGQSAGYGTLIDGFSMAGRVLLLTLQIFLRIMGWTALGIIALIAVLTPVSMMTSVWGFWMFYIPALVALILYIYFCNYRYALTSYLLMDFPDAGTGWAIRESVLRMRGKKWEYFKLELSFLGWYFLSWLLGTAVLLAFVWGPMTEAVSLIMAGQFEGNAYLSLVQVMESSVVGSLVASLVQLPLNLWLIPYQLVTDAGFYEACMRLEREAPPVYTHDT